MRPITPEDLWRLHRVGQPEPLPGGGSAVVPVTTYDLAMNRGRCRLHLVLASGESHPLTREDADSTVPAVDPAGRQVAFLRKGGDDDPAQLFVMRLDGGEAQRLTDLPLGAVGPRWLPDGTALLVWSPVYREHPALEATRAERDARKEAKVKARVTEDRLYRYWDRWLTGGEVPHLFRVDAATGEAVDLTPGWTRLLDFEDQGTGYDVSPDGSRVAFHALAVDPPYTDLRMGVYLLDLAEGEPRPVDPDGPPLQRRPRFAPDGTSLLYGVAHDWPGFYADRIRLVRLDLSTGKPTTLTEDWDRSPAGWEFTPDAESIVFAAEDRARCSLFVMPSAGGEPRVLAPGGWVHGPRPAAGGRVWCRAESLTRPAEVAIADESGRLEVVGHHNDELLAGLDLGAVEEVCFPGAGGDEIQMWVTYPPGFDPARRWPLVHDIHGGPHGVSGDEWHWRWNTQVFAAAGYVVAAVNFHGSSSWADEFARGIQGAWGDRPADDILAATDHLLARGFIDPERLALTGGSYGGYLVAWLIGRTDRFRTAICHAGVTNLLGQYATDVTHGRRLAFGSEPWEDTAPIHRWSPTEALAAAVTPTLVIHGEQDYRVVVTQGLELYGILQAKGVAARLVYYPDEGHWILKPQNSLHWYGEFLGWLERHLDRPIPKPG
ncbi:MAG: S9 family peptidase [Actinobacteria bacterium]|nr:S9 family peptidase [Actinomycetota bacterium]